MTRISSVGRLVALAAVGVWGFAAPAFDTQTDIVVVGSGGAGLCASLTAAEGGAKVVLLEKNPFPGGTSNAAEGIFGAETEMQREQLIVNTKDEVFRIEMEESNHWQGNAPLIRAYINESDQTFSWLRRKQGVPFVTTGTTAPEARGLRTWHLIEGKGHTLVKVLFGNAKANQNITIMMQTPGQELIMDGKKVVGVVAKDKAGKAIRIGAGAVIIATGGYAENREWVTKYCGDAGAGAAVPFNKTGDGIRMAMDAGAAVEGMSHMQWFPAADPRTTPLTVSCLGWQPTNILVNKRGERFCNEEILRNFSIAGNAIRRQGFGWSIFDENMRQHVKKDGPDWGIGVLVQHAIPIPKLDDDCQTALKGKNFVEANSLDELATKMGVPATTLKATMESYSHAVDAHYDADFLKPKELMHKPTGKLYAVKLDPYYLTSLGGVTVNPKLQALDKNWDVIPGLYVVGNDAVGGLFGDTYPLDVPGTTYGFAVNSGRMAAKAALKALGK
ncbi:FAD-dependent oxidoreductase [Holophaga foetida]|uniref:FAD-dependent oxidoreductase n=1 Tax=Holophaga foetida TaxID=35839 RepID=UPI00024736ED|nr:FAD-dependent oxidoreductase [Holophaga foetida]